MADKYANQGFVDVTPTLNTLSFKELATFVSVFEKKAFLVSRIEYIFDWVSILEFNAETDYCNFGMSVDNTFASATLERPGIFDFNQIGESLAAAGVSSHFVKQPMVKDLSTLPSGGYLIPCRPIYLWMCSFGWAAAGHLSARIYFTVIDLKAEEYWELVESTRLVGAG